MGLHVGRTIGNILVYVMKGNTHLDEKNDCDAEAKKYTLDLFAFCKKIEPYVDFYRKQIRFCNDTAHHSLKNEIDLILPQLPAKQKHGIITTLVSGFIGLVYEGISSILHNRRHKALHKAVKTMDSKTTIQHNKLRRFSSNIWHYRYTRTTHKYSTSHS